MPPASRQRIKCSLAGWTRGLTSTHIGLAQVLPMQCQAAGLSWKGLLGPRNRSSWIFQGLPGPLASWGHS